ncbi:hypothetical protein [Streptomyces lonarensis]|uniref:Lipoprotein n=1 Tax=Streptomyces lonarensis TaxID=700599 RepID=A0A7X6CZG2_9ACTN|nr:hypothetical protein [Streptomyces lonarensis]NJQ05258.1 hypothetical protein [Streptomyces lonarensis]
MNCRPRHAHRRTTTALATVAAAALLLSACGSDGAEEEIAGADRGETQDDDAANDAPDSGTDAEADAADAEGEDATDRPEIEVADSLQLVFDGPEPESDLEQAILRDNAEHLRAVYSVVTSHDLEKSQIGFYAKGESLQWDLDLVEGFIEDGETSHGVMRYFDRSVEVINDRAAVVSFCRDYSEISTVDFASGERIDGPDPDAPPTRNTFRLELSESGVWQATERESDTSDGACR